MMPIPKRPGSKLADRSGSAASVAVVAGLVIGILVLVIVLHPWRREAKKAAPRTSRVADGHGVVKPPQPAVRHVAPHAYPPDVRRKLSALAKRAGWDSPDRNPQGMLRIRNRKTGLRFVVVPAGTFRMGSPPSEGGRLGNEGPVHTVRVRAFLLSETECTEKAWVAGGGKNRSQWKGDDLPVEMVSWTECRSWCEKCGLRLPSESEWEYACRAESTGRWFYGDASRKLADYAWYDFDSGDHTHPVAGKLPNSWGLFDMAGSVWEWCEDAYRESYVGAPTDGSPWLVHSPFRVCRGGCWDLSWQSCRSASRSRLAPGYRSMLLGFRPAANL